MPEVRMPDGVVVRFPDTMSKEQIRSMIATKFPDAVAKQAPEQPPVNGVAPSTARSFLGGYVEGVPLIGGALRSGIDSAAAGVASLVKGSSYEDEKSGVDAVRKMDETAAPTANKVGQFTGSVAPLVPLGAYGPAARVMGVTGPTLMGRAGASAAFSGTLSGADTLARTGDLGEAAKSATIGTVIGGAIPIVGGGLRAAGNAVAERAGSVVRGLRTPKTEAARRVAGAFDMDAASGQTMSQADQAAAAANRQPVMNVDRGGEAVRTLARDAANKNPTAYGALTTAAKDRFDAQGKRVVDLFSRIVGGQTDDVAMRDSLEEAARRSNRVAYAAAENAPSAKALWNNDLATLTSAPAVQGAIREAEKRSANRAAVEGFKAVRNPFSFGADGSVALKPGMTPNLQFWDQVQRNLRGQADKAMRSGDKALASDIGALRSKLLDVVDGAVPEFKAARAGAAAAFGADNAIEAGSKFAASSKMLPEFSKAISKMTPEEKKGFMYGFASHYVDMAKNAPDSRNVINSLFGSQENREKMVMAFGETQAKEIEAFVRVERAMDMLRQSLGNSTTAKQLIASGALGGAASWWFTGDFTTGIVAGAGARFAANQAAKRIDTNVMTEVAELLLSSDPKMVEKALKLAAARPQYMAAVDALMQIAPAASRGLAITGPGLAASQGQE
jgi:hypothetical protein